jgi:hypothetical protein
VAYQRSILAAFRPSLYLLKRTVKFRGIPHLAKNERDVGHPATVMGEEGTGHC